MTTREELIEKYNKEIVNCKDDVIRGYLYMMIEDLSTLKEDKDNVVEIGGDKYNINR